jgi:methylated-DNA-[protein]-cysteine S-methyltransferase
MKKAVFKTSMGWIGLAATARGVSAVVLPKPSRRAAELELTGRGVIYHAQDGRNKLRPYTEQSVNGTGVSADHLRTARTAIAAYLAGTVRSFDLPLDFEGGTPFQVKVWEALQRIPYGRVRSYGWVARKVGKPGAARAVGAACGANPVPLLVPCHRVVAGDGSLGGFSGGLSNKRRLLKLEGTI